MEIVIAVLAVALVALVVNVSKAWRSRARRRVSSETRVRRLGPAVHLTQPGKWLIGHASDLKVQHRQVSLFVPLTGSTETRAALLKAARTGERVSVTMEIDVEVWCGSGLVTAVFDENAVNPWWVRLELGGMMRDLSAKVESDGGAGAERLNALFERAIAPQAAA
jgi:hypothetical protein